MPVRPHHRAVFSYDYNESPIPCVIWDSCIDSTPRLLVFLGTVQTGKLAEWTLEACPPGTIVVEGAPHWLAQADGSDIPEFMFAYTLAVFDYISRHYTIKTLNVIAESQGVPGALKLFLDKAARKHLGKLVLLQPLGFNGDYMGSTDDQRIRAFKRRIGRNMLFQIGALATDKKLRHNHRGLLRNHEVRGKKGRAQYASGLRHSALIDLKELTQASTDITIICGDRDQLFVPNEIRQAFQETEIRLPIQVVKGVPHSPLATHLGLKLLKRALRNLD